MANHNKPTNGFDKNPENINKDGAPEKDWTWPGLMEIYANLKNEDGNGLQKDAVVKALWKRAKRGDVPAIKEIMNRMDGMPKQSTDITSGGDKLGKLIILPPDATE